MVLCHIFLFRISGKISYDVKKIKEVYYYLVVKNLDKGEYFLGSSGFMFAFGID